MTNPPGPAFGAPNPSSVFAMSEAAVAGDADALRAYLDAIASLWFAGEGHLGAHLGIEILEVAPERVRMRMAFRSELQRGGGIFHGGAIMALADHVAGCVFNTDPRVGASRSTGLTTDFSASFLRAAKPGEAVIAEGRTLRRGRSVTFMEIIVRGETTGRDVATCRTTYVTVPMEKVRGRM